MSSVPQTQPIAFPHTPSAFGGTQEIAPGVVRVRLPLSNVFLLGEPDDAWVLVDAGTPGSAGMIARAAATRFGTNRPPEAIVLTHGHLDHIGGLWALLRRWPSVPVYAHPLEMPYLSGASAYPPPDPTVGGSMSALSPLFVPGPFDFRPHLHVLPSVPGLSESELSLPGFAALRDWDVLFTPGHAPGHVSLWRASDRLLIAGDAFVTTVQESLPAAVSLRPRVVHRPPAYYTPDWDAARASVERLAALRPELAVTGHGDPVSGTALTDALDNLAASFDLTARPMHGRYVMVPATSSRRGTEVVPPLTGRGWVYRVAVWGVLAALFLRLGRRGAAPSSE